MSPLVRQGVQALHRKRNVEFSIGHNTYMGGPEPASLLIFRLLRKVTAGSGISCRMRSLAVRRSRP